jgi:hypothetical protein
MNLQCSGTYHIEVQGQVDENTFNASGPLRITVIRTDPAATLFAICADQSGLIGLLRYLHQQGFVIHSVYRKYNNAYQKENFSDDERKILSQ